MYISHHQVLSLSAEPGDSGKDARQSDIEEKVYQYLKLADQLRKSQPDSALFYANKVLVMGDSLGDIETVLSAKNAISGIYMSTGQEQKALSTLKELSAIARSKNLVANLEITYTRIGNYFYHAALLDSAIHYYQMADALNDGQELFRNKGGLQNNIGLTFYDKGNYGEALEYMYNALFYYEKGRDKSQVIPTVLNIGEIYTKIKNFDKADSLYDHATQLAEAQKDLNNLSGALRMKGQLLRQRKKYREAENYARKSLSLARDLKNNYELSFSLLELAVLHYHLQAPDSCEVYLKQCEEVLGRFDNREVRGQMSLYRSMLASDGGRPQVALTEGIAAFNIGKSNGLFELQMKAGRQLAGLYEQSGSYKLAHYYTQKNSHMADSLANGNTLAVMKAQQWYETIKLKQEKTEIELKNLTQERLIADQRGWLLAGAILLILLIATLIYIRFRQRSLLQLHMAREAVNKHKILNLEKDQEMEAIKSRIAGEEAERIRLARELHDGVGGTLASIKLLLSKRMNDDAELLNKMDAAYREVRMVSRNLVPPELLSVPLTELLEKYMSEVETLHQLAIICDCYPEDEINRLSNQQKTDIYRILQELVTNVLKHADATKIEVQLVKHDEYINLMVSDDGKGFDQKAKGEGIGLSNIASRVQLLDGRFEVNSTPGQGTLINIDIPNKQARDENTIGR